MIESLNASITGLEQKLSDNTGVVQTQADEIANLKQLITLKDKEITEAKFKAASQDEIETLKSMVNDLRMEKDSFVDQNSQLRSSIILINQKLAEKEKTLSDKTARCTKLQSTVQELLKSEDASQGISKSDYDDLKQKLHETSMKAMTLEADILSLKENLKNSKVLTSLQEDEIQALKATLRGFTSSKDEDFDDTYEAVLKSEFDRMKAAFESRIAKLQEEMEVQRKSYYSKAAESNSTIEDLKDTIKRMTMRMAKFR
uniref:Uncharacterized protein n=1 Tax=Euplotes crassus TaxID=5936 RepID=A0A7S3KB07_EUPCR|mmetsp:Transcript_18372/g.18038  ORF Transcript_18372/g.18038 Transcript_18372/m.18038 type:complete len:258 (+) Transcript_18372:459-1232(+)